MQRLLFATLMSLSALSHADSPASTHFWLPSIIGDHMVLQAGQAVLWGEDQPGVTVTASLDGKSQSALAAADGRWQLTLPKLKAGGPFELEIKGSETRLIRDVLVGEVWLGSGQSNMEFGMLGTSDRDTAIPAANKPLLRLFTIDRVADFAPAKDLKGSWAVCTPESVKMFSGVAYHFGELLQARLKQPVGLIVAAWGGTPAETWVPRADIDQVAVLKPLLKEWDADAARHDLWSQGQAFDLNLKDLVFVPKDPKAKRLVVGLDAGHKHDLGGNWNHSEKADSSGKVEGGRYHGLMHGGAWGAMFCDLMPDASAVDLSAYEAIEFKAKGKGQFAVDLGQPNNTDSDHYASAPFDLTGDWKPVRVPIASLKQGGWGSPAPHTPDAVKSIGFGIRIPFWPEIASLAYNGMIAPLQPYGIKGVLWYQGESNAGRADQYSDLLSALILSWRKGWGYEFPFFIVQLPNWAPGGNDWVKLRAAQEATLKVPGTGMVKTMGLGDDNDIHPRNKTAVGKLLFELAMSQVYR